MGGVIALVTLGCAGANPSITQTGADNRAETNQLKLELAAKIEQIALLKADTVSLRVEVAALKQEAGGDINSTIALIVAIGATPLCFVVYMVSERFGLGRKVKAVFKGPCKRDG
jgi:hypothetical protein